MGVVQMDAKLLKQMLEGMVRKVIQDEILKLKLSLLPTVSDKEMEEITNDIGTQDQYEEDDFETLELDPIRKGFGESGIRSGPWRMGDHKDTPLRERHAPKD